jgi:hypothetical protein
MATRWTGLLIILLVFFGLALYAQSANLMDILLEEDQAAYGRAAYLALAAGRQVSDEASINDCMDLLGNRNWNLKQKDADEPISLGEYSYLLMQAFEMKGGLMYRLFTGPRYAARELAYLEIVDGDINPNRAISGEEVVRILGRLMEWKEKNP